MAKLLLSLFCRFSFGFHIMCIIHVLHCVHKHFHMKTMQIYHIHIHLKYAKFAKMNMHLFGYIYMFSQIHVHVHNVASDIIYMYLDIIQEKGACESLLFILNCACTCSYNVYLCSLERRHPTG